jgi:hypothetical protein
MGLYILRHAASSDCQQFLRDLDLETTRMSGCSLFDLCSPTMPEGALGKNMADHQLLQRVAGQTTQLQLVWRCMHQQRRLSNIQRWLKVGSMLGVWREVIFSQQS